MLDNLSGTIDGSIFSSLKSAAKTVKHSVGNLVRAPGEVAQALTDTAKGVGKGISSTTKTVPIVLIVAAVGVAGFLIYMGKAGKNVVPSIHGNYPELMGRRRRSRG
jgi:hypothetical protein